MIISVRVKTNSNESKIEKITDKDYLVYLKSKPENNRANLELIKLMKKYLKKEIKIIKGKKSKNKLIEIL